MKFIFDKIKNIGFYPTLTKAEAKRVRLLNIFCLCWFVYLTIFSLGDYFFKPNPEHNLICHGSTFIAMGFVLLLQYYHKFFIARILYLFISAGVYFAFANFLEPNEMMEYFLLLIPMVAIIFIDNKWINWLILIICYLSFYVPIVVWKHYSFTNVNFLSNFILFFSAFVIVNYFKNLNQKNEKRLEEQRNEALNAKLQLEIQSQELKELYGFQNHFMVNLSHEIRTPLTLIKSITNQLRKEKDEDKIIILNDKIDQNSKKIKLLVDNIIDIAKMKSSKLEMQKKLFPFFPFVIKTVASFDSVFKQNDIVLITSYKNNNNHLLVNGDKMYLERALSNLIMNAIKYSTAGDVVIITLSIENNHFKFEIKDTGCGIIEDDLDKIFLPFYRSQNSINQAGGSGVGLSFAQEVIALHDGKISVHSIVNEGSTFAITLPCLEPEIETNLTKVNSPLSLSSNSQVNILLVEDNSDMQEYLNSLLEGFNIQTASNGKKALSILQNSVPDLIITDYMMPEMNGYELVSEIKKQQIDCPVIVLTARMDEAAKLDFLRLGIDDYLTKPFNEEELLIRIEHSLKNNKAKQATEKEEIEESEEVLNEWVKEIKKIIIQNISNTNFGVNELAQTLAMTERTLNRKVKLMTGLTPNGLIREVKLLEAKQLIESNENISLKEITITMGFKNSTHFATLYETRFGKKPFK